MEDLDLDAFIANIEESAPQEDTDASKHLCQECDTILENVEGTYICPNCSAQATNILQLEQTELHYDESGRAILGQRVNLIEKRKKHDIDYGWAWSTDEAIVHILDLQLTGLEKVGLIPEFFRQGVKNMWFKFWIENVAPFIKDEYSDTELVTLTTSRTLKSRDIEVLVKVRDKVMIPQRLMNENPRRKAYRMMGAKFFKYQPAQPTDEIPSSDESANEADQSLEEAPPEVDMNCESIDDDDKTVSPTIPEISPTRVDTTNLNSDNISILTLNRTLAFIEAAARCLNLVEPIFASDIVRACNQRLIPFFGAHKTLPDGMRLNHKDKLMFQKTRPPSPLQITRTASLLIHKIYNDRLPVLLPVPNLDRMLARFITDLNLPNDLINHIRGQVDFFSFRQTRPHIHKANKKMIVRRGQQYDRWAFAILLCQMKKLFNFDEKSVNEQSQSAINESNRSGENFFVLRDWVRQMSMRLHLILSYDPYVLFHPMTDISKFQSTPQVYNYLDAITSDRASSTTRYCPNRYDETRSELTEFLKRELPKPAHLDRDVPDEQGLDKPVDMRHPILDAFRRTKRFWISEFAHNPQVSRLLFEDFSNHKIFTLSSVKTWSIYDNGCPGNMKLNILPEWPYCYKLLLSIGGYLCYCEPKELLREIREVDEFLYPHTRVMRKTRNHR